MQTMKLPSRARWRDDIREKTLSYLERTTFHGVLYFARPEHYIVKIFWFLIITFGIILCGVLCKMTLVAYYESPTIIVVETTHFPINNLIFPAIIVCDTREFVYRPHTENITTIFLKRGYNKTSIEAFYDALSSFNMTHPLRSTIVKMHDLLQDLGISLPLLLDMFATPCDKLLSNCFWRSLEYNCTDMFYGVIHSVGYCCRFDVQYFRSNIVNTTYFGSGYMASEGLRFLVNTDIKDTYSKNSARNIKVRVIPPHRPLMMKDDAIPISPNNFYEFTIDAWVIETSKSAKLLAVDDRRCLMKNDTYREASFYSGCIEEGFHSKLLEECKCRPFYYRSPLASLYPNCTWLQSECILDFIGSFTTKRANITSQFNCYPDCDHVEYITLLDYAPISRLKIKHQSMVTVHLSGNPCVKYRRNLMFTWDQLLASLGGLFGLCTGGSIISVIEFVLFVSDVLITITLDSLRKWSKNRKVSTKVGRNQVFFIRPKYDYKE